MSDELTAEEHARINCLVEVYREKLQPRAERLAQALFLLAADPKLRPYVHSAKMRSKDPEHLRDKLARKMIKAKTEGAQFDITEDNLFGRINDLAGVRILHLHTSQFPHINDVLTSLLASEEYQIIEGPRARVWDSEYSEIFSSYGIQTETNPRLYSSVHYIVSSGSREVRTAEIQVRTLAEELWGEVDHTLNYPHKCPVATCQEQIKVLARVTSSCTRLVDSIFMAREQSGPENVGHAK